MTAQGESQRHINIEVLDVLKRYNVSADIAEAGLADALTDYRGHLAETFTCDDCRERLPLDEKHTAGDGPDVCEDCHDIWFQNEMAYWSPLYEGERRAGLVGRDWE